jgi:chorismate mutase/prephenate dehydratase
MHGMNKTSNISELRQQINAVDSKLVEYLNKRAELALALGEIKTAAGKKIYDPTREGEVITKIDALNQGPLPKGSLEEIYRTIITACREIQVRP